MSLMTKVKVSKGGEQVRQAAAQVAPIAATARITAQEQLHSARAWTAPRLERAGTALQERIAPNVSDALTRAARRIEPKQAKGRRRWPLLAAGMILAGGLTAAAAIFRGKLGSNPQAQQNSESEQSGTAHAAQQEEPAAADANGRVHTH